MRHCFQTTSQAIDDEWGRAPENIGLVKLMNHLYPFPLPINIPLFGLGMRRVICGTGLVTAVFVWWVSLMFIAFSSTNGVMFDSMTNLYASAGLPTQQLNSSSSLETILPCVKRTWMMIFRNAGD
jgi:hypothetical protein